MAQQRGDISVNSMLDFEESRLSGHNTSIKDSADQKEMFQATRRWHLVLSRFFKEMPQKIHRRFPSSYANSFTGKEAVDFLLTLFPKVLPNKPFDVSNGERFMQLLLTSSLVENVRDPKAITFNNNATIYRFIRDNMIEEIRKTAPQPRSNSLTSSRPFARSRPSNLQQSSNMSRRISSSYANLQELVKTTEAMNALPLKKPTFNNSRQSTVKSTCDTQYDTIAEHPVKPTVHLSITAEAEDFHHAWTELLLSVVGSDNVVKSLAQHVYGSSIKWNSLEVGPSGVVKIADKRNDLSNDIKKNFKKLMEWTPVSEESPDGIFASLYTQLCCISPIIRDYEGKTLAAVWMHFSKTLRDDHYDNQFIRNDKPSHLPPFSASTCSTNPSIFSQSSDSSIASNPIAYIDGTPMRKRDTRAKFHENLAAVADAPDVLSSKDIASIEKVTGNMNFRGALQILLLSFNTTTRRRLNLICRYISRIGKNEALILHGTKNNLTFLCEKLSCIILDPPSINLSLAEGLILVRTLITCHQILFSPSQKVIESAQEFFRARVEGKPAPSPAAYCRRVNAQVYQQQMTSETKTQLLELLDSICYDENLTQNARKKKLSSFQKTYPEVYKIRYPESPVPAKPKRHPTPTGRMVNKIRTLVRRDSSKRN